MHVDPVFVTTAVLLYAPAIARKRIVVPGQPIGSLYPKQLEGLDDIIDTETSILKLWRASHGYTGLWKRYRNHIHLVRLCQIQAEVDGNITPYELAYTMRRALVLVRASRRAALWGIFGRLLPERYRRSVRSGLQLYRGIAYQTHAILRDYADQSIGEQLASVL